MKLSLVVPGVPPKKDGANSMWRKRSELSRLKALRLAAVKAIEENGQPIRSGEARLVLRVYAPAGAGDLDNFITGVCDSLMAADSRTPIDPLLWDELPEAARPDRPIVFVDDACITKIHAERLPPDSSGSRYELELEIM